MTHWPYASFDVETLCHFTMIWVVILAALYNLSWTILNATSATFRNFPTRIKADNASRVVSTVHTVLICPALTYGVLTSTWDQAYEPITTISAADSRTGLEGTKTIQFAFTITVAYMVVDLVATLWYLVPSWQLFAAHHVLAAFPYVMYLFNESTAKGIFALSLFMLVEYTCLLFNFQTFFEAFGTDKTTFKTLHKWLCVLLVPFWFVFRVVNVVFLLYIIHMNILPNMKEGRNTFMVCVVCGWGIALGCIAHWFLVVIPAAKKALSPPPPVAARPRATSKGKQ